MVKSSPRSVSSHYPVLLFVVLQPGLLWTLPWPNYCLATFALAWLFYRFNQVLRTPVDELVHLLGLEVPTPPSVSLLEITSSTVSLHWEQRASVLKYVVRVNGIVVGEVGPQQNSIIINNLPSSQFLNLRVVAVNAANFHASSESVRVRTLDDTSANTAFRSTRESRRSSGDAQNNMIPNIAPYKGSLEALIHAPLMIRQNSGSQSQSRKSASRRRSSPFASPDRPRRTVSAHDECVRNTDSLPDLTARLDLLRKEAQEIERQDKEEEDEFEAKRKALLEERENFRAQLREKEDGSKELKKSVTSLERANAAAQSKKSAQERIMHQKTLEREKMRDDKVRWEEEVEDIKVECERLISQKAEHIERSQEKIMEIKEEQQGDLQNIRNLEDQIRERGIQVKDLEEAKRELDDSSPDSDYVGQQRRTPSEDHYNETWQRLALRYQKAHWDLTQAQAIIAQHQLRFETIRRGSQQGFYPNNYSTEGLHMGNDIPPSIQGYTARVPTSMAEPAYTGYGPHLPRYPSAMQTRNPPSLQTQHRSDSPFFDSNNLGPPRSPGAGMMGADIEALTGGALISPSVGGLLPAGLLGDDMDDAQTPVPVRHMTFPSSMSQNERPSPTAIAPLSQLYPRNHPLSPAFLPGLGQVPGMVAEGRFTSQGPTSPTSLGSRSPSLVNSPHTSFANLHHHKLSEGTMDSDARSIHSVSSQSQAVRGNSTRFGSIFHRQRGKTTSEDLPALGTLRPQKTQSMPKSDWGSDSGGVESPTKRAGTSGTLFGNVGSALLGRRSGSSRLAEDEVGSRPEISRPMDGRPAVQWGAIGPRPNPWAPEGSSNSRPASVYSENVLPRPDMDNQPFGWSSNDLLGRSSSTRTGQTSNYPWGSSHPSRRPSLHGGDSSSQLAGPSPFDEDSLDPPESKSPPQAPIGTKPSKLKTMTVPTQLNPNARDFRSIFVGSKRNKKEKEKSAASTATSESFDDSAPQSRASRDGRSSFSADGSIEDIGSSKGESSVPATPHEPGTPGTPTTPQPMSANRESFMRKLTRKTSSTSKFGLGLSAGRDKSVSGSFFSRRGGNKESSTPVDSPVVPQGGFEEEVNSGMALLGRSVESVSSSPMAQSHTSADTSAGSTFGGRAAETRDRDRDGSKRFSLSSFKKRGGRKGNDAPSVSELSMTSASVTTDDEGLPSASGSGRPSADE